MIERRCPHGFIRSMRHCEQCGQLTWTRAGRQPRAERKAVASHWIERNRPIEAAFVPAYGTAPREIGYDQHGRPVYR